MQSEGRPVRRDAFQWAVLAGLVFLLAAVLGGSAGANTDETNFGPVASRVATFICITLCFSQFAVAEDTGSNLESVNPRETYNLGFRQIRNNLSVAEDLLSTARQDAGCRRPGSRWL